MFFKQKRRCDTTIDLPIQIRGMEGICAIPVSTLSLSGSYSSTILCLQDNHKNVSDLVSIEDLYLQVKVGAVKTTYGTIIFLLFILWDTKNENDRFTYEVLLNPSDKNSYGQYILLDTQKDWDLLVVSDTTVLKTFKFENIYDIGSYIKEVVKNEAKCPCVDFSLAKEEYFQKYTIDELIQL